MEFTDFIKPELFTLVPVLIALGAMVKKTEKISDKYIPLILTVVGIVLCCVYIMATEPITMLGIFTGLTQGILVAAGAVYSNQLIKQSTK